MKTSRNFSCAIMSESEKKAFGPLNFDFTKYDFESIYSQTKCMLCDDSFNLKVRLDIFLKHLASAHNCIIEDVQNIKKLPQYIHYWRDRFKNVSLEQLVPSVKIDESDNRYFVFCDLLKEDKELRHRLTLDFVLKVQEYERTDTSFVRQCLFCKLQYEGSRQDYLNHLSEQHNLQLGNPQNLVFIEDLINVVDQKLQALTCIFCEGIFPERSVLKEHMRKKLHKRINPSNSEYDRFYIVNYLEVGKSWKVIEQEDDRYALPRGTEENSDGEYSDWNEKEDNITCLFCSHVETEINMLCDHMISEHGFDFTQSTKHLDYYQKIKLVNYLRRMMHDHKCPYCEVSVDDLDLLHMHMREMGHCKYPDISKFDQPEFYFPTYENDAFLYLIDDVED